MDSKRIRRIKNNIYNNRRN